MFVRVRSAGEGDPPHEFDIPVAQFKRRRDCYIEVGGPHEDYRPQSFGATVPTSGEKSLKKRSPVGVKKKEVAHVE